MRAYILLFCLFTGAAQAGVYKKVLPNGQIVFTDKPGENTTELVLSPLSATIESSTQKSAFQSSAKGPASTPPPPSKVYRLSINSPENNATIRNNSGELKVSGYLQGNKSGKYELILDGEVIQVSNTPHFKVKDISRGSHKIQILLKDNTGKLIASSHTKTIHMHRASALLPSN
ncbi:DUF4124 domain-containing protein [Alteromonas sp. a30]|uniref:DUF4124 domain-containing protein n=1 Tax=Alteromonas sp. a30 TaxID=2730917 RepID=UPI00227E8110|nr:DUF4124 domain-containing protein [Alteromonas sp. a30]MCY7296335.1 DUF4124 domain-containing protein [Alteromonas sp. a30]